MAILIIAALEEETQAFFEVIEDRNAFFVLGSPVSTGKINNKKVVVAQCGVGKVNAAALTASLIERFEITLIINTGCAGGVHEKVSIGDVVVADKLFQHDVDVQALGYEKGFVPGTGKTFFADRNTSELLFAHAAKLFKAHRGGIASGDQFVSTSAMLEPLSAEKDLYAVEMEGAAIAHVAFLDKCPCAVIRAISDKADSDAQEDFPSFVSRVSQKSAKVVIDTINDL